LESLVRGAVVGRKARRAEVTPFQRREVFGRPSP